MEVKIYRIVHIKNLPLILKSKKLSAPNFANDDDYIPIGETELIRQRAELEITKAPYGTIKDYIAFYFGVRSPMLYCIKNGFDVKKRSQQNIIYLVSSISALLKLKNKFVFTDGHAYAAFTMFFNNIKYLDQIDWDVVNATRWNNTETDPDRKRKKQAECFIYKELELGAIQEIVVYNKEAYDYISSVLNDFNTNIPVKIKAGWYY